MIFEGCGTIDLWLLQLQIFAWNRGRKKWTSFWVMHGVSITIKHKHVYILLLQLSISLSQMLHARYIFPSLQDNAMLYLWLVAFQIWFVGQWNTYYILPHRNKNVCRKVGECLKWSQTGYNNLGTYFLNLFCMLLCVTQTIHVWVSFYSTFSKAKWETSSFFWREILPQKGRSQIFREWKCA